MQEILRASHSGLRWLVLIALIVTIVVAFMRSSSEDEPDDSWLQIVNGLFLIQVVLGIIIYFLNQGWEMGGFIAYWHPIGMIAAIGVFQAGLGRGRRQGGGAGWRTVGLMTLLSVILVIAAIPWQRGMI